MQNQRRHYWTLELFACLKLPLLCHGVVIHVDVAGRVRAVVAAERSMIYLLYCAAPCVLHTITADFFSLMMLKMELKLFLVLTE